MAGRTTNPERYPNRANAGRVLAEQLMHYAHRRDLLVYGLPRGGVPVAYPVAEALEAPLDVFLVRKLGVPGHEELAMGAIASGGIRVLNREVVHALGIRDDVINSVATREQHELQRREGAYRSGRPAAEARDRTAIVVDDGLATGSTMRAAVSALRGQGPARTVVGVPTGSAAACDELRQEVDEVVCIMTPEPFHAVGLWYEDFSQTTDEEITSLLARSAARVATARKSA
ncbi:MAG: phosphoribosyltransferase [Chloroflexi bacterium]|nr:phosphoribosyltransferase [Chloroflexota bacterium]